jgi:hypothetical protein
MGLRNVLGEGMKSGALTDLPDHLTRKKAHGYRCQADVNGSA